MVKIAIKVSFFSDHRYYFDIMIAFENDGVLLDLAFYKWIRLYHVIDPNDKRVFNYHFHRLTVVLMVIAVQLIFFFGTIGVFMEFEDTVDTTTNILLLSIVIYNLLCALKLSVIVINADKIWKLLNVTRVQFLESQHCRNKRRELEGFKKKFLSIFRYVIFFFSMTWILWMIYPLIANIEKKINGDGNERYENIYNLRYPVDINTYNRNFWVFYGIEIVITLYLIIAAVVDTFIVSICIVIFAQYEILQEAFASIGTEHESDTKSE